MSEQDQNRPAQGIEAPENRHATTIKARRKRQLNDTNTSSKLDGHAPIRRTSAVPLTHEPAVGFEFRVLGPLEVIRGQQRLPLGSPKQRALLGLLVVHANEPIPRERLIEELWGDAAPKTVNAVLNVYLTRLRRLLTDGTGEQLLLTQAAGYVLSVPPEGLDARRFEALLERGRRELASGEAGRASLTLRDALALWRGPALADLAFEAFAQTEIARLEELRLSSARSPDRSGPCPGTRGLARRRAPDPRCRTPVPRGPACPADARSLPQRSTGRGARDVQARAADVQRGVWNRARPAPARAGGRDPAP